MALAGADHELVVDELGREPTDAEAALFENLWSEHCAYRSSRALLQEFESSADHVVIGPGDDAAVVALNDEWYLSFGIESHNHPSYVDPYDGAATGVGGIVRDTLSMGAYPIALADCLYFGDFDRDHTHYLFEGVVEGIADYGNAIGVPTVGGSVQFHPGYVGNPLVNVACVGLVHADRLVTATAQSPGNKLVIVGNATGRDGLGGASFASEDLGEDAETEDRPAVQVGDPYSEKLLIEANEALLDAELVQSARDLGAAGLGGATSELVAKGAFGATIELDRLHQREPNMNAMELLLAESQERMCYEVRPEDVELVQEIADRFELGCSVIGTVSDGDRYVATFNGETVVDVPVEFLTEEAPLHDWEMESPTSPSDPVTLTDVESTLHRLLETPAVASKAWIYRQYDHEVGVRTTLRPGDDAAVLALPETDAGLAIAAGAESGWTAAHPRKGAAAIGLEVASNLAAKGATPIAAVDCLNGGNPETPEVYGGFAAIVSGLASMCSDLEIPVVGGNVSLYNDSETGPIPPTPTVAMIGETPAFTVPDLSLEGSADLILLGPGDEGLAGSHALDHRAGEGVFFDLPGQPRRVLDAIREVAQLDETTAVHDVSHGGIGVTIAEMITSGTGAEIDIDSPNALFCERPGRAIVETTEPDHIEAVVDERTTVKRIGSSTTTGELSISCGDSDFTMSFESIETNRSIIAQTLN